MTGGAQTYDVAIIGSGLAGLAAGVESLRAGCRVLIVEKRRHTGGNSRISDGVVAAAATEAQQRAGVDDSPQLLLDDMLAAGLVATTSTGLVRSRRSRRLRSGG